MIAGVTVGVPSCEICDRYSADKGRRSRDRFAFRLPGPSRAAIRRESWGGVEVTTVC